MDITSEWSNYSKIDWHNLPVTSLDSSGCAYVYYVVEEIPSGNKYRMENSGALVLTDDAKIELTNTLLTDITVEKKWVGGEPENVDSLDFEVTRYIVVNGVKEVDPDFSETLTVSAEDNWTATLENLEASIEKDHVEYEFVYTATETSVPDGYSVTVSDSSENDGKIVVTNQALKNLSVIKQWSGNTDLMPDTLTIELKGETAKVADIVLGKNKTGESEITYGGCTVKVKVSGWTADVTGLPANEKYTFTEKLDEKSFMEGITAKVETLTVAADEKPEQALVFTNYLPYEAAVTKAWISSLGGKPENVPVDKVYAKLTGVYLNESGDEKTVEQVLELSADNSWTDDCKFFAVYVDDDGKYYDDYLFDHYTVAECMENGEEIDNDSISVDQVKHVITNTLRKVTAKKVWKNVDESETLPEISFQLYRYLDGDETTRTAIGQPVKVPASLEVVWNDLPAWIYTDDDTAACTYGVEEIWTDPDDAKNYMTKYSDETVEKGIITVTNTRKGSLSAETELTVTKQWYLDPDKTTQADDEDIADLGVVINILRADKPVVLLHLINQNGEESLQCVDADDCTIFMPTDAFTLTDGSGNAVNVTDNTIYVNANWVEMTIELLGDSNVTLADLRYVLDGNVVTDPSPVFVADDYQENKKLILDASNEWTGSLEKLPVYAKDDKDRWLMYAYDAVEGDESSLLDYDRTTEGTVLINNLLEKTDITVKKEWKGDPDGTEHDDITVTLKRLADGQPDTSWDDKTITLGADNDWTWTSTELPHYGKDADGKWVTYTYTVEEAVDVPLYDVTYSANNEDGIADGTLTITNTRQTFELPATGGSGTVAYTVTGLLMSLFAAILLLKKRRA